MRFALVLVAAALWAQPREEGPKNPFAGQPEAIEKGGALFRGSCSACHGPNGEGGRGPNLTRGRIVRRASDQEIWDSIKKGIPGTDMPPSPLPEDQVWQLVAYVRHLTAPALEARVPGDPEKGRGLFFGKARCAECHMIAGQGGFLGPDLTNIGISRSAGELRESLIDPNVRLAAGYQGGTAVKKDGTAVTGVVRDNTNYVIQILDAGGELHLLAKKDLREVILRATSLMPPDYKHKLTSTELQDLLAFLSKQATRKREEE